MVELEAAIERVIAGPERKSRIISDQERKITAYHEAGHALLALLTPGADPLHKVSIIPRGTQALGYTMQLPLQDRYTITRQELLARLTVLMGGRTSEELIFGKRENQVFLGRDLFEERNYSEQTAVIIDEEIRRIIDVCHTTARTQLSAHREQLERLAKTLLEKEVLEGAQVAEILKAYREGRELPSRGEPARIDSAPRIETGKEKSKEAQEEAPVPGLPPKPVLA